MSNAYTTFADAQAAIKRTTPQSQAIPGREAEMKRNNAGGVTFTLDQWGVLDRFLVIGSEGGNYYVGERDLTKQSFDVVKKCVASDGLRTVARAVEYSVAGRAPKNDPAVVVLALAAVYGDEKTKEAAFEALPKVAPLHEAIGVSVPRKIPLSSWSVQNASIVSAKVSLGSNCSAPAIEVRLNSRLTTPWRGLSAG